MFKSKISACLLMLATAFASVNCARAQDKPAEAAAPEAVPGEKELALRLCTLAQETLRNKIVLPPHFRQAAAFLMAAHSLDPSEPRYLRMLYDAQLNHLHDNDAALETLRKYRQLRPNDQWAMLQFIDLKTASAQTAEARLEYLRSLIETGIPAEVRSYAAMQASKLARERGLSDLEQTLVEQAIKLNPLNLQALRARLAELEAGGTPTERVGVLLQMLQSNPIQPAVMYRLARECADAGLVEPSLNYYNMAATANTMTGAAAGREFALGFASELCMMGQNQLLGVTKQIVDQLIKANPNDVESLLLRWIAERGLAETANADKTKALILNAAANRFMTVRMEMGAAGAATRPVDAAEPLVIPDLAEDLKKLEDEKFAPLLLPYAQTLTDLTWYLVYVAEKPDEAQKLLPALRKILSETDPVVVRIEGFIYLKQGKKDEAGVKLKAVADKDVLAAMGNVLLDAEKPEAKEKALATGRQLLRLNPSGLLGAILMDGMKPHGIKVVAREDAQAIQDKITAFPKDWLRVIDAPHNFYVLKGEMDDGRVLFPFGEPMFGRITIRNIGQHDITIGPEGVIKDHVWIDAQLRGLVQANVFGVAYERITDVIVLKPGKAIAFTVRVDQGPLAQQLQQNPQPSLAFYGHVRTNPRGEGGSGPCGYGVPFTNITERTGFSLTPDSLKKLADMMNQGKPVDKFRALELLDGQINAFKNAGVDNDQTRAAVATLLDAVEKTMADPVPAVSTWASFMTAAISAQKGEVVRERLLTDEKDAVRRLLGLMIANRLTVPQQDELLKKVLAKEKEEMVRQYALGMREIVDLAMMNQANQGNPATQPATKPATSPAPTPTPTPTPLPEGQK